MSGADIPTRTLSHVSGIPLIDVGGLIGCYVELKPTKEYMGSKASGINILLTPDEVRELAYWLRVQADLVGPPCSPGEMR